MPFPTWHYLDKWRGKVSEFFRLFGRVPFFYYVIHIPLIHITANIWNYFNYNRFGNSAMSGPSTFPEGYEPNLWLTYLAWLVLIPILFWLSRWFNNYKKVKSYWWLKYL